MDLEALGVVGDEGEEVGAGLGALLGDQGFEEAERQGDNRERLEGGAQQAESERMGGVVGSGTREAVTPGEQGKGHRDEGGGHGNPLGAGEDDGGEKHRVGDGDDGAGGLLVLAEFLVIAADELGVAARDGVAVEGNEGILGGATGEFLADLVADLDEGLEDLEFDLGPVGLGLAAVEIKAGASGLVPGVGDLGAEVLGVDELLDVAEAVRPLGEVVAGKGAGFAAAWGLGTARAGSGEEGLEGVVDGGSPGGWDGWDGWDGWAGWGGWDGWGALAGLAGLLPRLLAWLAALTGLAGLPRLLSRLARLLAGLLTRLARFAGRAWLLALLLAGLAALTGLLAGLARFARLLPGFARFAGLLARLLTRLAWFPGLAGLLPLLLAGFAGFPRLAGLLAWLPGLAGLARLTGLLGGGWG